MFSHGPGAARDCLKAGEAILGNTGRYGLFRGLWYAGGMKAWIVRRTFDSEHGNRSEEPQQTLVHADTEAQARERGAATLGVPINSVTVIPYAGPTLGTLAQ